MSDKRTTLDDAVAQLRSGMTIGIGGWGSRRKPMAFVRAMLRTDVTDLTVVTYGGPDLGLLCSAGKVKRVYYGFVSLDSPPFYDPWFAKARTGGAIEAREMDEGMLRCGLQAAAQRLPFLPIRAGLGSSVPDFWEGELQTVTSPYPAPGGGHETLIAMPALRLDAAFVHLNLGDSQGNAAYTGIDPYFDDLFLMAADRRYLSVERVVSTQELVKAVPPQALLVNRMMVDARGGGAERRPLHHRRTGLRPRREIPAALRRGRRDRRGLAEVRRGPTCRAARPITRRPFAHSQRRPPSEQHPRRSVRGRLRRIVQGRRRNHGQPDDEHGLRRRAAGPADVLTRHPADRRRGAAAGGHPGTGQDRSRRRLDAVRPGVRDAGLGAAARGDGRQSG